MPYNEQEISRDDLVLLTKDHSPAARSGLAAKLAAQYRGDTEHHFLPSQLKLAEEIFRVLMKDATIAVRQVLSENLKYSKELPPDIALKLAQDVEEVAVPMLECSEVLGDEELIEIIKTSGNVAKQLAIAGRGPISPKVSDALAHTNQEKVVEKLLANQDAEIEEPAFAHIVEHFPDHEPMIEAIINSGSLTASIAELVMEKVSGEIRKHIEQKHHQRLHDISIIFDKSRQVAALKLMGLQLPDDEVHHLVKTMEKADAFSPVSALCMGNLELFYVTLARQARIPLSNAKLLIADKGNHGFDQLMKRAGIPDRLLDGVHAFAHQLFEMRGEAKLREQNFAEFTNLFAKRLSEATKGKDVAGLTYLVGMMRYYSELK